MPVRVKICGITNAADAVLAVEAGADAIGFIFYSQSPRFIEPALVREIIRPLPPFVLKVGVFVNASQERIDQIVAETGINIVQLHGDEPPELCAALDLPVIKAFRMKEAASIEQILTYRASAFLLDSYVPGQLGGTGEKFNWELATQGKKFQRPIILAGGLTPENVSDAIGKVQPYAVDVSSGVEASPGRKDPSKLRAFIKNAKAVL